MKDTQLNRRSFLAAATATGLAALAAACGPAGAPGPADAADAQGEAKAPSAQGTADAPPRNRSSEELVLAAPRDLANGLEDPYFTHLIVNAWNSLSKLDNDLVPQPELAES